MIGKHAISLPFSFAFEAEAKNLGVAEIAPAEQSQLVLRRIDPAATLLGRAVGYRLDVKAVRRIDRAGLGSAYLQTPGRFINAEKDGNRYGST